ncbi:MFS transporter [Novosphingobium mangrovi (ex Hu et al. 2023)]|uniref:MFS transporter n=1 Tax=Novosphingobium mangrovi (ex Hu et al. 2023) TaxID=2930094 RepID=A0ABT0AG66_9SPHN|nr:MFS transporter [Novosphingobium mangrovi (ex Hu et al. 2023)]MCJ1962165.1 MFS transporter [Novosphingobium mangrovi (ex Hu et al. 2023)]
MSFPLYRTSAGWNRRLAGRPAPSGLPSPILRQPSQATTREARLLAYAAGNFGKNITFSGAEITFLFLLTELLGLRAATAGGLMLLVLAGDLVFDLLAARIVIAMQARGRSYRWLIVAGAAPCGLAFAGVYALPFFSSQIFAGALPVAAMALVLVLFRGAYAVIDVPHNALMTRVSADSRVRARVSGYRRLFSSCSSLTIALVLTPIVQEAGTTGNHTRLALAGGLVGLVFTATMIASARYAPGTADSSATPSAPRCRDGLRVPLRAPLVLAMLALAALTGFAPPAFERMLLYMGEHVLAAPGLVTGILTAITIGQFAGVAAWTALTARIDSTRLLMLGHATCLAGLTLFALTGIAFPMGTSAPLLASALVMGFGQTAIYMLPWSLLADVVDALEWQFRRRFEAGLFAIFLVAIKASGAASTASLGLLLDLAGYSPGDAASPAVRGAILALGLALPAAGSLAVIAVLTRVRLGHARHARIRRALVWREGRQ